MDRRTPVGTALGSAALRELPVEIRQKAQFSAQVESVRMMEGIQRDLGKSINLLRGGDRATFVANMQKLATELGIRPPEWDGKRGTIQDIASQRRLELIYDVQTKFALGDSQRRMDLDPDVLQAAPAQELTRVEPRQEHRPWSQIWRDAGGQFYGGRMIALKTDDIWTRISDFGLPYPPFKFGSGMGLRDVLRAEAIRLGLIEKGQRLDPGSDSSGGEMDASLTGVSEPLKDNVQAYFGDTATTSRNPDGTARIYSQPRAVSHFAEQALEAALGERDTFRLGAPTKRAAQAAQGAGADLAQVKQFELQAGTARRAFDHREAAEVKQWDELPLILRNPTRVERVAETLFDFVYDDAATGEEKRARVRVTGGRARVEAFLRRAR